MPESRPEFDDANFIITHPSGEELVMGSLICITWTSYSMANKVRLDYSVINDDDGSSWQLITESALNQGSFRWRVPSLVSQTSRRVRVRVSSAYDDSLFGISPAANRLVSLEEAVGTVTPAISPSSEATLQPST